MQLNSTIKRKRFSREKTVKLEQVQRTNLEQIYEKILNGKKEEHCFQM